MTDFLASIHYNQWILHVLVLLPLAGAVPVLLGDERSAKRMALVITSARRLALRSSPRRTGTAPASGSSTRAWSIHWL